MMMMTTTMMMMEFFSWAYIFRRLTENVALTWLSGLRVPVTLRAMPVGVFTSLVLRAFPSWKGQGVESRLKSVPRPSMQVWGLGLRLPTSSCKKYLLREQQKS